MCAYGVTLGSMHCFGQKFPLFMIWNTETKMGAVQMAIIWRPDHKKAKTLRIWPNDSSAVKIDNEKPQKDWFDEKYSLGQKSTIGK